MECVDFVLPLYVVIPRKTKEDKKVYLNMNTYRNLHHMVNNQIKQLFEPYPDKPGFKANKIRVSYKVYKKTKRKYDLMNIISVVDKFFLDWLVNNGAIPDDCVDNVEYGTIEGEKDSKLNLVEVSVEVLQ